MINDRGSKKWASLMLPEHKELLHGLYEEQFHEAPPTLDEQTLLELSYKISYAVTDNLIAEIIYMKDHHTCRLLGHIIKIDSYNKLLTVQDKEGVTRKIQLDSIVDIII